MCLFFTRRRHPIRGSFLLPMSSSSLRTVTPRCCNVCVLRRAFVPRTQDFDLLALPGAICECFGRVPVVVRTISLRTRERTFASVLFTWTRAPLCVSTGEIDSENRLRDTRHRRAAAGADGHEAGPRAQSLRRRNISDKLNEPRPAYYGADANKNNGVPLQYRSVAGETGKTSIVLTSRVFEELTIMKRIKLLPAWIKSAPRM